MTSVKIEISVTSSPVPNRWVTHSASIQWQPATTGRGAETPSLGSGISVSLSSDDPSCPWTPEGLSVVGSVLAAAAKSAGESDEQVVQLRRALAK